MIQETPEIVALEETLASVAKELFRKGETKEEIMGYVQLALDEEEPERGDP